MTLDATTTSPWANHPLFQFRIYTGAVFGDVLRFYEIPVLFTFSVSGRPFIAVLVDEEENSQKWSTVQLSFHQAKEIADNRLDIHSVFRYPDFDSINLITLDLAGSNHKLDIIRAEDISEDIIPMEGTFALPVSRAAIPIPITTNEVNSLSSQSIKLGKFMVDLRLKVGTLSNSIELRRLGEVSKYFQEFLDAAAVGILGQAQNFGRISEAVKQRTSLDAYAFSQGSFILNMVSNYTDLYGNELLESSLRRLEGLTSSFDNNERLEQITGLLGTRAAVKYQQLLHQFESTESGFEVLWASPTGDSRSFGLSKEAITTAVDNISKFTQDEVTRIKVIGTLVAGSIRTNRFEIENVDQTYSGYAEPNVLVSDHEASLGMTYIAEIEEIRMFNRSLGKEVIKYRLTSLVKV